MSMVVTVYVDHENESAADLARSRPDGNVECVAGQLAICAMPVLDALLLRVPQAARWRSA